MSQADPRPSLAVGHVMMRARGVRAAADRLVSVGVRPIVVNDELAVLELRGGTHLIVQELEGDTPHDAAFDFMVDDLGQARERFCSAGFDATPIQDGRIHRSFRATAPERFVVQVFDSHAGDRPV